MKYVALLRGIGPMNPNMRNDKICVLFKELGLKNVHAVISTGNIIFEDTSNDTSKLENLIEEALPLKLGFTSNTIIRSQDDFEKLTTFNPFGSLEHSPKTSLNVTFTKQPIKVDWKFPYIPDGRLYSIANVTDKEIFSVVDTSTEKTPDLMAWLERQFGKQITTRTWKTVNRILTKMQG